MGYLPVSVDSMLKVDTGGVLWLPHTYDVY